MLGWTQSKRDYRCSKRARKQLRFGNMSRIVESGVAVVWGGLQGIFRAIGDVLLRDLVVNCLSVACPVESRRLLSCFPQNTRSRTGRNRLLGTL